MYRVCSKIHHVMTLMLSVLHYFSIHFVSFDKTRNNIQEIKHEKSIDSYWFQNHVTINNHKATHKTQLEPRKKSKCTQNIDEQRFGNRAGIKFALSWLARIVTKQYWYYLLFMITLTTTVFKIQWQNWIHKNLLNTVTPQKTFCTLWMS